MCRLHFASKRTLASSELKGLGCCAVLDFQVPLKFLFWKPTVTSNSCSFPARSKHDVLRPSTPGSRWQKQKNKLCPYQWTFGRVLFLLETICLRSISGYSEQTLLQAVWLQRQAWKRNTTVGPLSKEAPETERTGFQATLQPIGTWQLGFLIL